MTEPVVVPELTVCFLTIVGREHLMAEKWRQLSEQTYKPGRVEVDYEPATWETGHENHVKALVRARNRLTAKVETPWMLTADDDDFWMPDHIETVWKRHLEVPTAGIVYPIGPWKVEGGIAWGAPPSARNPAGGPYVDQGSFGAMITEALIEVETFRHWGGFIYVDGINEDVATDIHLTRNCGVERVYTDHFTYRWERGEHLHAVDVYGPEEEAARRALGWDPDDPSARIEEHVRRTAEGYPQIHADVANWGVGSLRKEEPING
jgi:hypothetical protein